MNESGIISGIPSISKDPPTKEITPTPISHKHLDMSTPQDKTIAITFNTTKKEGNGVLDPTFLSKSNSSHNPNTKFAHGILSTLEQYSQPDEFLYCMKILIFILGSDFSSLIPEEMVSEIVYYLSLFNNIIAQALHNSSPKEFMDQPRIYRQLEYFTSIFWRMVDAMHDIYFPHVCFPNVPVHILDPGAQEFWKSLSPLEGTIADDDAFVASIKQYFEKSDTGVIIDESVRQELMFFLDPIECGVITIFKFAAFVNFFRPFKDCIQNMHQFHNCLWFRGYVSYSEGHQILAAQPKGTFLLHFAQHCPCPLVLTCATQPDSSFSTLIDRYSPMLLSTEGIRQKWCKDAQVPCEINFSWNRVFFWVNEF